MKTDLDYQSLDAISAPLGLKRCMECGRYRASVDGGWCADCDGQTPAYDPACVARATTYLRQFKSAASLAAEAWAEREMARGAELRRSWRERNTKRFGR